MAAGAFEIVAIFAETVRSYIAWVDNSQPLSKANEWDELWRLHKILSQLQAGAVDLPISEPLTDGEPPHLDKAYDDIEKDSIRLRALKIPYATIYNALLLDDVPVHGYLSGDLAEIYHDVASGLIAYERGLIGDAAFEWQGGFHTHWAKHANHAQGTIHDYLLLDKPK
jgi:hypothetical protein